ncbi:TetR/AcrR family transcriptional regulator [Halosegnis sp.]|uniref:TetR/AcrR family transcriptional regulator n=1 Tax=Halosegnis sp. TaxID=2864959 RepID=UPI0035D45EEB
MTDPESEDLPMSGEIDTDTATDRTETEIHIMEATYRALCRHGYADLSVADIAAEFPKSKSLLYYHYDSKEELIVAFLGFAVDQFLAEVEAATDDDDPIATVRTIVDHLLVVDDSELLEGQRTIVELRGQAVSEPRFREQFTRVDDRLRARIQTALTAAGAPDPEATTELIYAALTGAMTRRHTAIDDPMPVVREELHQLLDHVVDGDEPSA